MANREALRELQSRLAVKLETVKTTSAAASWLAVETGGQRYLLPLRQSGEIFPVPALQPVAYTQPWFLGVASLRGGLFGVADLARFIGTETPHTPPAAAEARLVTLNTLLDVNCALRIERLLGLRSPESFTEQTAPADDAPPWFGHRYTDADQQCWQEINLQQLCSQERFVHISASHL